MPRRGHLRFRDGRVLESNKTQWHDVLEGAMPGRGMYTGLVEQQFERFEQQFEQLWRWRQRRFGWNGWRGRRGRFRWNGWLGWNGWRGWNDRNRRNGRRRRKPAASRAGFRLRMPH